MRIESAIHNDSLADILERVLQNGIVIAGDVSVSLVGIELLTIKLRLLIASVDKAKELGINWWEHDPMLTARPDTADATLTEQNQRLSERLALLEERLATLDVPPAVPQG